MQGLLGLFSLYFLRNELKQMKAMGLSYLASVWNYLDLITPITILSLMVIKTFFVGIDLDVERSLQAVGVFFMWLKFLYFFRIFESFGYLIRIIIVVIFDMRHFLVVLLITIIAFGDSFLTLSLGNQAEDDRFVKSFSDAVIYTYRIVLGDFNVDEFGNVGTSLVYILFILCTVFNSVVMLNLLVAIISETFSAVKANAYSASYQERAAMIAENTYLIPKHL